MSVQHAGPSERIAHMPLGRVLRAYAKELRYESLRMLRTPAFAVPTLLFPALLYLLVGFVSGAFKARDPNVTMYLFFGFATMGAMTPGLFSFGVGFAAEREQGLHRLKRALPMPPGAALIGKIALCMFTVAISVAILTLVATLVAGVQITVAQFFAVTALLALGAIPFCALGLMVGAMTNSRSAPAIVNLLYLLMLYLSGLFIPLPDAVAKIVLISPAFYLHQLALHTAGAPSTIIGGVLVHVGLLIAMTVLFTAVGARRFARED